MMRHIIIMGTNINKIHAEKIKDKFRQYFQNLYLLKVTLSKNDHNSKILKIIHSVK